ncbi:MAG: NUDIX domain-containing protein [Synechocystis sp.]
MTYRNPAPTVDLIIEMIDQPRRPILLIERQNPPHGWALPGGFVDYGESLETAAVREAKEEICLDVQLIELFYAYSDPRRDPRQHTLSVVFIAAATGRPQAADDAKTVGFFDLCEFPRPLCFDHDQILQDYLRYRYYGLRPDPRRSPD